MIIIIDVCSIVVKYIIEYWKLFDKKSLENFGNFAN
jgi:general stress protein CsbA